MILVALATRGGEASASGDARAAWIRIDRNELAGAFGDIGTDLPLLVGMALASGANGAHIVLVFGALQILSALLYGLPMPVQPLKAVAALVIAQELAVPVICGAGFAIGVIMLALTLTGLLEGLARLIPKAVVRGIQIGLGLKLALVALGHYIPAEGGAGLVLAAAAAGITAGLWSNRRWPAALFVVALGLGYATLSDLDSLATLRFTLPAVSAPAVPEPSVIFQGLVLLALPQIPLSLGNSILATQQVALDCFPHRRVSVRRIGLTYALMNVLASLLQGFPVCHGSGGMAGHYAFGGRTGGSVLIYGLLFIALGLLVGSDAGALVHLFPLPILGVLLLAEAAALIGLARDVFPVTRQTFIAGGVALIAAFAPYGFLVGMVVGTAADRAMRERGDSGQGAIRESPLR